MTEIKMSSLAKFFAASAVAVAMTACSNGSGSSSTSTGPTVSAVSGSYVFSVTGTDSTDGDYFALGSFVADGKGNITSGIADYNLGSGIDSSVKLTGNYTVGGNTAIIHLTDGGAVNDSLIVTLATSGTSPITSFDGNGSGTLYPQTTSGFSPVGTYNYTVKGEGQGTVTGSGNGLVTAADTFATGMLTYTDAQTTTTYSSTPGFLNPPQTGGRGQAALVGNNLAYYVVSPTQVLMINLDEHALLLITATKS